MKKILTTLLLSAAIGSATAQNWTLDNAHSTVGFGITHLDVAKTMGIFTDYATTVSYTKEDLSDLKVEVTIQTKSITTWNEMRDKHLASPEIFDAEKYPTITFKSTSVKKGKGNAYKITGDLTMHGVTKPVTFDMVYGGTRKDPYGNTKAGFSIKGQFDRTLYGVNYGSEMKVEGGGTMLSKMVDIMCEFELMKAK